MGVEGQAQMAGQKPWIDAKTQAKTVLTLRLRGSPSGFASRWVRVSGFLGFVKWQRKGTPRAAKQLGGPEPEGPEVNATGIGGCGEATAG